jgi:MFS family permease
LAIGTAAFMPSWLPFAIVYVFWNAFNALQSPVFMPFVGESVPPERRGHAFGLLEGVIAVGIVIGPLLGARLLPAIGAKGLFLITAAVIMSTATVRHLLLRETRPKATGSRPFAFSHIFSGRLRLVLLSLVLSNVVLVMANWGPFMSLHASDAMGLSKAQINLFFALGAAVGAASSPLGGRAVARFGPHRVLALACLGLGLCALLWMVQRNLAGIALGYLLINFFFQWGVISNDAFRVHAVDESIRGVCLGSMGTLVSLSTVVVVPLVGFLKQLLPTAPFWMATVAAVGLLVVTNALTRADATEPAGLTAAE